MIRRFAYVTPLAVALALVRMAAADPVTVRYPEGETHGFLILRSLQGQTLAHGELTALAKGDRMESRLTWRFRDGSFQDEFVIYLQRPVLELLSYKQIQRGPSFPADVEVAFTREPSHYEVKQREKGKKDTEEYSGTFELPPDVYNGMTATILNNLAKDEIATGHVVAFTPKPRLVKTTMRAIGEDPVIIGDARRRATRYLVDLEVGGIAGVFAKVVGKEPPDLKFWVLGGTPPAFVKFEGPFFAEGPIWRIELSAPRWPK
ncbi:MAG TPA: hypothetical protein VIF11_19415 [Methylomirabilota bacterium]|jgi:hypothetical protein